MFILLNLGVLLWRCLLVIFVPVEPLLVELDHDLWNLDIGLLCWHKISLVRSLPLDEEVEFPRVVGGANDLLCSQSTGESLRLQVRLLPRLLLLVVRLGRVLGLPLGASLGFLVLVFLLELGDDLVTVEISHGLPGVVVVGPPDPFHKVLHLALLHPLLDDGLDLILSLFLIRHVEVWKAFYLLKCYNQAILA